MSSKDETMAETTEEDDLDYLDDYPPSFTVELHPEIGPDGKFRTENDPNDPDQRDEVMRRKHLVDVGCSCIDIVHGYYSLTDDTLYSLIVLEFRFDPLCNSHRVKKADISVIFAAKKKGDADPVVEKMHPNGHFSVQPTTRHETTNVQASGNVGGNVSGVQL